MYRNTKNICKLYILFYSCDAKLNYSSLQCHMILQKSFKYTDLMQETFIIIIIIIIMNAEKSFAASYFYGNCDTFYSLLKRIAFMWKMFFVKL